MNKNKGSVKTEPFNEQLCFVPTNHHDIDLSFREGLLSVFPKGYPPNGINTCVSLQLLLSSCALHWVFHNVHACEPQPTLPNAHIYA